MRTRWLGCIVVACLAATAHAKPGDDKLAKVDEPKSAKPKGKEKGKDKDKAKDDAKKPSEADKAPAFAASLTDDPRLARADRIEGTEAKNLVTFTFDDGPNPSTTPAVIDALEKYGVPATFFIVSQRIVGKHGEKGRELLARLVAGGFQIASHSYSHPNLRGSSAKKLTKEIDEAVRVLSKEAGRPIGLFRAPFGALDATGRTWLKKRGLTEAFWSIDTLDWKAKDSDRLRKKVMSMIVKQDGGVVLLHDVKPITAKIIAGVLDDLEAENCKRLGEKREPILPVSIHYFLRDKKQARAIPDDVKKTTEAYRASLPGRCAKRPPPPAPAPAPAPAPKK